MFVYHNNDRENASNPHYPYRVKVNSIEDLSQAVSYDNTPVEFKDNHRSRENFGQSDCIMLDVDNTHSDNPSDWVSPADIQNQFPDVPAYVVYSRNHMKPKGGKSPRPKFHVYFPVKVYTSREEYENLKDKVCRYFPVFDPNAKDSARFFFGVENPKIEFFDGELLLSDFVETIHADEEAAYGKISKEQESSIIPEGTRHCTLVSYAARVLKRHGDTEQAALLFKSESEKCVPRLSEEELTSIWSDSRTFFHEKIESSPDYLPPELYEIVFKGGTLKPEDFTDLGQTKIFVRESKDVIRYSPATDYLIYTSKVWKENAGMVHRLVQLLTDSQFKEVSFLMGEARKKQIEAIIKDDVSNQEKVKGEIKRVEAYNTFVLHYRHTARISAVLTEAKPMVGIDVKALDKDGDLLNTPAGIIDLRTGKQNPHNPLDYCTKITAISPDLRNAEVFYEFLGTITCNDKALEDYLQLISGMCLIGKVYCENLIIAYGGGKNGKSTFFNLISMVMGDYSGTISAEVLMKNSRLNKKNEFAELRGKRLVLASELEEGRQLDSSAMKQLCSTDAIHAEKKFKQPFSFTPTHTTILCTNHLPSIDTLDEGTWRRLVVVPFNAVIQDSVEVKNYAEYLFQNCGGAVLSWMIEGAQKFIRADYKLSQPTVVKQAIETYCKENNWIQNFLSDCCEIDRGFTEKAGDLYNSYRNYCKIIGEYPKNCATFKKQITAAGYTHKANSKGSFYYGLKLKTIQTPYVTPPMVKDGGEIEYFSESDLDF